MDPSASLGRWLFIIPFALTGLLHFMNVSSMTEKFVPNYLPFKEVWVLLTGAFLIAASLCMVIGKYEKEAALALAGFMILLIVLVYVPATFDPNKREAALPDLLKNLIIAGAALMYREGTKE